MNSHVTCLFEIYFLIVRKDFNLQAVNQCYFPFLLTAYAACNDYFTTRNIVFFCYILQLYWILQVATMLFIVYVMFNHIHNCFLHRQTFYLYLYLSLVYFYFSFNWQSTYFIFLYLSKCSYKDLIILIFYLYCYFYLLYLLLFSMIFIIVSLIIDVW